MKKDLYSRLRLSLFYKHIFTQTLVEENDCHLFTKMERQLYRLLFFFIVIVDGAGGWGLLLFFPVGRRGRGVHTCLASLPIPFLS